MPVCEAQDKADVAPGTLHFAPPGITFFVERDRRFAERQESVLYSRPRST